MLRSCKYCGRIHDSKYDCGRRPKKYKKISYIDRFRNSRAWKDKRREIRERDREVCQACFHGLCGSDARCNNEELSVHHITPLNIDFGRRLDNLELITLCAAHHEMAEAGKIPAVQLREIAKENERGSPGEFVAVF